MQGIFRIARQAAFIALMLRALMPSGWMPDTNGGLMICSATTLGVIHHDGAPQKQQDKQQECPFAAAAQLAAAPDAPQIALPAFHAFTARTDRAYAVTVAARFTPQSPRAPPAA
ncbi:MAG: hypothetical protein JWP16_1149 [Alphaproteobacteria bacterium]|jgi:hypothetical protein|nr:hypothetical protein [Alphaproteobacteria bacterium]